MSKLTYFPEQITAMDRMVAMSPDGDGFKDLSEKFNIKHIANEHMLK